MAEVQSMKLAILQNKMPGLKTIRLHTDDNPRKRSVLRGIYLAILEMGYDNDSDEYEFSWKQLAYYSSFSEKTIKRHIMDLHDIGVVSIDNAPSPAGYKNVIPLEAWQNEAKLQERGRLTDEINKLIMQSKLARVQELK